MTGNTRTALLETAEGLIRRRGYGNVSYADLAARVGVSKASIHHHFPAKADLAMALLASYDARYVEALAAIRATHAGGAARVHAYAELYRGGVGQSLGCLCAAYAAELDALPAPLAEALRRFFAWHIAWVEAVLAEGVADGSVATAVVPAASARLIVAALEGALMMERLLDGDRGFRSAFSVIEAILHPAARES